MNMGQTRNDSVSSGRSSQKFSHKVMKMNMMRSEPKIKDEKQTEAEAKAEEEERKERQRTVNILMDHGVTAAHSREISNRAREVSNRS